MRGSYLNRYGDNIYHLDPRTGRYIQEDSFHSEQGGVLSLGNYDRDTGITDRVLIGCDFTYWGGSGPKIPASFSDFIVERQGHKCNFDEDRRDIFLSWILGHQERGYLDEPALWKTL